MLLDLSLKHCIYQISPSLSIIRLQLQQKEKSCWPIFPLVEPILCAVSLDNFFENYTLTLAKRKTFHDTKRHLPYWNPYLTAVKSVQLLHTNRA